MSCVYEEKFSASFADVHGVFTTPVALRWDTLSNDYYGPLCMGDHGLDVFSPFKQEIMKNDT